MTGTVKQDHNNKYHIYITKQKELKFFDDKWTIY
jgi:hypothetical protein